MATQINQANIIDVEKTTWQPVIRVNGISFPVGGGDTTQTEPDVDLSFITAGAGDILSGKVGSDTEGNPVNGSIPSKEAQTYTPNTSDQTIAANTYLSGVQTIKGDANFTEENIAEGVSMWGKIGTHKGGSSMDFYKCAAVHEAQAGGVCYIISGCPTAEANGTYLPTEYTITDHNDGTIRTVYFNGTYYYFYEPNTWRGWCIGTDYTDGLSVLYSNSGSAWFAGTPEAVEGMTCTESTVTTGSATWDGYKAVLTDGMYSFEETLTTGLTYSVVTPEVNGIYSADALVEVKNLYDGSDPTMVFYAPLSAEAETAETGQALATNGTVTYGAVDGVPCATLDGQTTITFSDAGFPTGTAARTMSCWVKVNQFVNGQNADLIGYGASRNRQYFAIEMRTSGSILCGGFEADLETDSGLWEPGKWYHVAVTKNGSTETIYLDGNAVKTGTTSKDTSLGTGLISGVPWASGAVMFNGSLASCRIYNRVLTDDEIFALANEFTPTA